MVLFVAIAVSAIIILIVAILIGLPEFCIFGTCFNVVSQGIINHVEFWMLFIAWLAVQAIFIAFYIYVGGFIVKRVRSVRSYIDRAVDWSRRAIERL